MEKFVLILSLTSSWFTPDKMVDEFQFEDLAHCEAAATRLETLAAQAGNFENDFYCEARSGLPEMTKQQKFASKFMGQTEEEVATIQAENERIDEENKRRKAEAEAKAKADAAEFEKFKAENAHLKPVYFRPDEEALETWTFVVTSNFGGEILEFVWGNYHFNRYGECENAMKWMMFNTPDTLLKVNNGIHRLECTSVFSLPPMTTEQANTVKVMLGPL